MKILIVHYHSFELWHAPAWIRERLQQDFSDHHFIQLQNYDRVPEEIADTDVFIGWSLRPQQFVAAKKLRWIHSPRSEERPCRGRVEISVVAASLKKKTK